MNLHGFKDGKNIYNGDILDKLTIPYKSNNIDLTTMLITDYISERWEEHSLFIEQGRKHFINDDKRLKRLEENINEFLLVYHRVFNVQFIKYRMNSEVEGFFVFLNDEMFMFISPIICFYYNNKGYLTPIYFRNEVPVSEEDYFLQLNQAFILDNISKREQLFYSAIRDILIKSFYTSKIDGNLPPSCTLSEHISNYEDILGKSLEESSSESIVTMYGDIKEHLVKSKHNFKSKYMLIVYKDCLIVYNGMYAKYIIDSDCIFSLDNKEKVFQLKSKDSCTALDTFLSKHLTKEDEKAILKHICSLYKPKRKFFSLK